MNEQDAASRWVEDLLRPAVIAAMMVCLTAPLVVGLEWLMPGRDGTYMLGFAFLASMEGILSERALAKRGITGWGYYASRGAEALLLFLLLKLVSYIPLGLDQLLADARVWISDPGRFLTNVDLFTGVLFLLLWTGSLYVARITTALDVEKDKRTPPPDKTSTEYYLWLTQPPPARDRQEKLGQLGEYFVWGGIGMLLAATAIHFLLSSAQVLAVPILLYFALGIVLLSQARFSVNHAIWQSQGIAIQPGIARRWLVWAVLFLVGIAALARILPTQYTMGPLQALLSFISILFGLLSFLVTLLLFLITFPLSLLLPQMETPTPPALDLAPLPPPEAAAGSGPPVWLQSLMSAFFWLLVLAIVGYAVLRFWRDRFGRLAEREGVEKTWWGRLLARLRSLWQGWRTWRQGVQAQLARRRAERRGTGRPAGVLSRFFFPGRLPPRDLVRYFYLSAVRRAAQAGQPRRPGQTPYEYRATLDQQFPELEPDLEGLTEAFVQARYSHRPVPGEQVTAVKPLWQRIKAALQRRSIRH